MNANPTSQPPRAAPIPTPETQHFWEAAREGRFLLPRCRACAKAHWYPRQWCPFCWSDALDWQASPGTGVVYSYTVMRHGSHPFVLAFVTLDEGPSMLTHLVGQGFDDWNIGDAVQLCFEPTDGEYPVPVFRLRPAGHSQPQEFSV